MKISEIFGFIELYDFLKQQKLSFQTSYKLVKFFRAVQDERDWYREEFNKLLNDYAELDDEGHPIESAEGIKLKPDTQAEFIVKMNELNNTETTIQLPKFTFEDFNNLQDISLEDMQKLLPLITEE